MKLGCVIMASGEGKRFGSNKMLADIYGEPLIARTIDSVPVRAFRGESNATGKVASFCRATSRS